ncbi:hypothetical protein OsccyDRAFT_0146 [Leptolyngbyaceae cyanobacterium JSC-12]|nr:hypothetical protein OsccyDRAFT_0146 [Leptolyngbyaceae cyanobacterium JSC-12]
MTKCCLCWRAMRLTYPWLPLLIMGWRTLKASGLDRDHTQVRFWLLLNRIDFANLWAIALEMIQPEYWA